jgi:hypothetical protein
VRFLKDILLLRFLTRILTGLLSVAQAQVRWRPAAGFIPNDAVTAGFEEGRRTFVCRAAHQGGLVAGKIGSFY